MTLEISTKYNGGNAMIIWLTQFLTKNVTVNEEVIGGYITLAATIFIMFCGMLMLLGAVGIKFPGLGTAVANNFSRGIGFILKNLIDLIKWLVRTIGKLLKEEYRFLANHLPIRSEGLRKLTAGAIVAVTLAVLI